MSTFSILLPLYQREDLEVCFERVIKSCFNGEVLPETVLIVIDGHLDESFERKLALASDTYPISIVRAGERVGLSAVLNLGLAHINTDYVFRVDGDDFSRPLRWRLQLDMLEDGYDLVGGAIQEIEMDGTNVAIRDTPESHVAIVSRCLRRNPFNHMTVAYRTSFVRECGGYPHVFLREDWALWIRMIAKGANCRNSTDILVDATADLQMYRRRGGLKNVIAEISLQRELRKYLNKSVFWCLFDWLAKSFVLLSPSGFRVFIYKKMLRK